MSYSFGKSIVTDGLVFYVDAANENSYDGSAGGTTWTDLVGSNDGRLTNMETNPSNSGYAYDSGNGGSIVFDGSNDYTDCTSFVIPSNITVVAWVNPSVTTSTTMLPTSDDSVNDIRNWQFRVETDNRIGVIAFISVSTNTQLFTTDTIADNTWNMVSFTIDGTNLKIQINGVEKASTSFPYSVLGNGSAGDLLIGSRRSPNPANFFNGKVSAVQIYNRALSTSEILQNYNALKNRFV